MLAYINDDMHGQNWREYVRSLNAHGVGTRDSISGKCGIEWGLPLRPHKLGLNLLLSLMAKSLHLKSCKSCKNKNCTVITVYPNFVEK